MAYKEDALKYQHGFKLMLLLLLFTEINTMLLPMMQSLRAFFMHLCAIILSKSVNNFLATFVKVINVVELHS